MEYDISWQTKEGQQSKKERATLQLGITEQEVFAVTGTELAEVSVRVVADTQVLAGARSEVAAARVRQEALKVAKRARQKAIAMENRHREEEARRAEEERRGNLFLLLPAPISVENRRKCAFREEQILADEERQLQAEQDEIRRQEEAMEREVRQRHAQQRADDEALRAHGWMQHAQLWVALSRRNSNTRAPNSFAMKQNRSSGRGTGCSATAAGTGGTVAKTSRVLA